ncbi:MAG: hypothetical protein HY614_01505, partial [Candidatus Rokubacteria bacterium]|nr:hypothetical protein [Candidatus Rokubacteria bacterium]
GYSERLVFVAPGSFRHLAALDGKDHGQGTVEVRRFGDFLFVKNPKTGARIAYESKARVRSVRGIAGGMAKLLAVFDAHPRSVSAYRPAPFCTIAGCEAGVVKVGIFGEYQDRSYSLPGAVSIFSGDKKVAEGSGSGPGFGFVLPPGAYRLRVTDPLGPGAEQELAMTVAAGEDIQREVVVPKGLLRIRTVDSAGKPRKANVWIYSGKNERTYLWGQTSFGFLLSAGAYTARVEDKEEPGSAVRTSLDVTVETGKALEREVKLARGTLLLRTFESGGKPLLTNAKIFQGDTELGGKSKNSELRLSLTPGTYRVRVRENYLEDSGGAAAGAEAVVTIEDGKTTAQDLTVPGGTLTLRSLLPDGKPADTSLKVFAGDKVVFESWYGASKLFLAPGAYRIRITERKTGVATLEAPVTVEDGKTVHRDLTLPAGVLSIRTVDQSGKPVRADLSVHSGDKRIASQSRETTFELLLPPGRYRLELTDSADSKRREALEVTLEAGKTLAREVKFVIR